MRLDLLGRNVRIVVLSGIAAILFGTSVFARPGPTLFVVILLVGIYTTVVTLIVIMAARSIVRGICPVPRTGGYVAQQRPPLTDWVPDGRTELPSWKAGAERLAGGPTAGAAT